MAKFIIDNSNEQISHLLVIGQRQILSHLQSAQKEETLVRSHQAHGQSAKAENSELGQNFIRTPSPQRPQILRLHVDKKPYVGCD